MNDCGGSALRYKLLGRSRLRVCYRRLLSAGAAAGLSPSFFTR
jgi:hypothetical protein